MGVSAPALGEHMAAGGERTVGFFDLAETGVPATESVAEDTGRLHIQPRLDAMARNISAVGGVVIKQIGYELMCALPDPSTAVELAVEFEKEIDALHGQGVCLALRVGLHFGPVVEEDGDLFGDTVNVAARMTSIAAPGQIIVTKEIFSALPASLRAAGRLFDEVRVKGSMRQRTIYRIMWSPRAETMGDTQMPALRLRASAGTLTLHHATNEIVLVEGEEDVRLGRDARCELIVPSEMASRFHAIIGTRSGKFVLRDQSTNGTWVRMQGSPVVTLQREELPLFGEGIISLGEVVGGSPEHLIRFTCF